MKTRLHLLNLPPSTNAIWRHTKGGQTYRAPAYQAWMAGEGWNVRAQLAKQRKFTGPIQVTLAMRRPRANADLDNRSKACLDLLQHVGAIANDRDVMRLEMFWTEGIPAGVAAEITIAAAAELAAA